MRRVLPFFAFSLLVSMASPAGAQIQDPILSLPDGQVILNISATEMREVEEDLLVGNLNYVVIDRDARLVQNKINETMKKALDTAKKEESLKVSTGMYQVYEYTDPRSKEQKWRGQQSITIKSTDAESVLETARKLQDMGLNMEGLSYTLSPETSANIQDSLMEAALKQLQERANRAAKALGKSGAELREVNVQGGGVNYNYAPRGKTMMMESVAADMAAPVASAGESTISLSVNARAILKP